MAGRREERDMTGAQGPGAFLREQAGVFHALVVREIYTRFGRENIGFAWIVVEPTLFCLGVIAMWTLVIGQKSHVEIPLIEFLITGYMPLLMYRHAVIRLQRCMQVNVELLYHRQVTVLMMYAARLFVEIVGALAAFIITTTLFVIWGLAVPPADMSMVAAGFGVYALFSVGIATLIGALSERSELVEKFWNPLSYVMIPLTGTFYMLYWLPAEARNILMYVPPVSGVEMIRGGYFGPGTPVYYDWQVAVVASLVMLAVGLLLLRDARRFIEAS